MSKIDFPPGNQTPYYQDGVQWDFINGSWVKKFDYVEETSSIDNNIEYARFNGNWREITYPIPSDVSEEPGDTGAETYARQGNAWIQADFGAAGPAFVAGTPGTYGLDQASGLWVLMPNDDLTTNYYDKTASDARFSLKTHQHTYGDGNLLGFGTMAAQNDDPGDGKQYVRKDNGWEELVLPAAQTMTKSITIIDPVQTDDAPIFFTPVAINISSVSAAAIAVGGGATVIWNVKHSLSADGSTGSTDLFTSNVTTTENEGAHYIPDAGAIPANSWVWGVIIDPPVGTEFYHLTLVYSET